MKMNKWTLGLAAAGLVSLPVASQAEEKPNQVLTAVANTSISGYVDTSAHWNPGTGNANPPRYKFNDASKSDGFNLNVVQLRIEKPPDEGAWAAGYRVDLWFGPDATVLGTSSLLHSSSDEGSSAGDFAIRQAYVALRMPVGNGIDWKIGVFDSIIGFESVESPANPNYTRSYGHSIEPQTHTGVLASYHVNNWFAFSAGVANTKGPHINARAFGEDVKAESYKTYMGSLTLTAPEDWGWVGGSTLYAGVVNGLDDNENGADYDENSTSYYAGGTLNTPLKGLKLGAAFDWLHLHNWSSRTYGNIGETWAASGDASFQVADKLSIHGRAEYLSDKAYTFYSGVPRAKILALTGTIQYDLWANVLSRLEVRWDHSLNSEHFFGGKSDEDEHLKRNEVLVAANVIYKF